MNTSKFPLGLSNATVQHLRRPTSWIWQGVICRGAVTLLSAPEKTGKSTLLSLLLDRRRAGGLLLGRTVAPGRTVVCTEENEHLWALRQPPLNFGPEVIFRHPRSRAPTIEDWDGFMEELSEYSFEQEDTEQGPPDLLVIDTAVRFLPLQQRNKQSMRQALSTLTQFTCRAGGVLIINQSHTVHRPLAAFADIVIEMSIPRGGAQAARTRRRRFTGVGRDPETLQAVDAELNREGTDYLVLPDSAPVPPSIMTIVQTLLAEGPVALTHHDLLTRWPGAPPHPDSLWRALNTAVQRGLLTAAGQGTRTDQHRYGLTTQPPPPPPIPAPEPTPEAGPA